MTEKQSDRIFTVPSSSVETIDINTDSVDELELLTHRQLQLKQYLAVEVTARRAIKLAPQDERGYVSLGSAQKALGQLENARENLLHAISLNPAALYAHVILSSIKTYSKDDPQIDNMEVLLDSGDIEDKERRMLHFTLAKAYEDCGDVERVMKHVLAGKHMRREEKEYDKARERHMLEGIKLGFSVPWAKPTVQSGSQSGSKTPIFVVGMPRSGTSLVEQILASHSLVHGAGELTEFHQYILQATSSQDRGYGARGELNNSAAFIDHLRREYEQSLTALDVPEPQIVDKMPHNFRWLGLIASAFPEAKFVQLERSPQAVCWSIFKRDFLTDGHGYANDMEDLAAHFALYQDIMEFWHKRFPGRILRQNYEALTRNQEEETRRLLSFCDLPWEEQCLDFHRTERVVLTASLAQVRQKMYTGSSDAWKPYADYLQPMLDALAKHQLSSEARQHGVAASGETAPGVAEEHPLEVGLQLQRAGKLADAARVFSDTLKSEPDNPMANYLMGTLARRSGDLPLAEALLKRALKAQAAFPEASNSLGQVYQDQARLDDAFKAYSDALSHRPDYYVALHNMGRICQSRGELEAAVDCFQRSVYHASTRTEPVSPQQSGAEPLNTRQLLTDARERLDSTGVNWYLSHASLLGVVRDGQLLSASNRGCISVLDTDHKSAVISALCQDGCFQAERDAAGADDEWMSTLRHSSLAGALNLYFVRREGGQFLQGLAARPRPLVSRLSAFELTHLSWEGQDWPAPDQSERYLGELYGRDWRVPDPDFDTLLSSPLVRKEPVPPRACYGYQKLSRLVVAGQRRSALAICDQLMQLDESEMLATLRTRLGPL